ncbi:MAG: methionyl-tRNA formyltransferase [Nitrospinota bacterium]|nr:methionyl-tRNA formyltransferase [Nitrospinota bacterium]
MKTIYFGNGERGLRCLEEICQNGYLPEAVVVHPAPASELENNLIRRFAISLNLPVYAPASVNKSPFIDEISSKQPDLMILSGYGKILKKEILSIPRLGTINLHGGLLPKYRGGSPINWQIINDEKKGGCAIIFVDEGIDTGDIIVQETYEIGSEDTAGDIYVKTLEIFPRLLVNTLEDIANERIKREKQNSSDGSYYKKRYPEDSRIFWETMSARQIYNFIRALNGPSLPGAFTYLENEKIVVLKSKLTGNKSDRIPGEILGKSGEGVIVSCLDEDLLILEVSCGDNGNVLPAVKKLDLAGNRLI